MHPACSLLEAVPLVSLVHAIAWEWSLPHQRKGKPLDFYAARAVLCDFEGSPCDMFETMKSVLKSISSIKLACLVIRSNVLPQHDGCDLKDAL